PQHKGLMKLQFGRMASTGVFSPEQSAREFSLIEPSRLRQFLDYAREGVWHIWIGFDHILFLLSLLLPAVMTIAPRAGAYPAGPARGSNKVAEPHLLEWRAPRWQPVDGFRAALWDVFRIVTSFTVAHS